MAVQDGRTQPGGQRVETQGPAASVDRAAPLERAARHRLMLGLFLPLQDGGWSPSTSPRGTTWTFPYNAALVQRAEALGFDLAFGLAQWLPAGGHGGRMRYREQQIDPLVTTAGLAALTQRMLLISTVHVLYGWHPLQLAKIGATLDHMSGGRWGLNVVTGYKRGEWRCSASTTSRTTSAIGGPPSSPT